jgi:regulator of protease activity HflC (stomatin/prohibitin superfamily)
MERIETFTGLLAWLIPLVVLVAVVLPSMIRILREYERGVIFRLGKLLRAKGPGLVLLIPIVDRMVRVDLRVITIDVPKQDMMTRDNVPVSVDAVLYFRIVDGEAAIVKVENFLRATSLIAQTTLRSIVGQAELDELLAAREKLNKELQDIIDRQTDPWGIKVTAVEVKDVVLPESMRRAMARQAEVERDRRAKVINAEGEFQAASRLVEAGEKIATQPVALQLRFLQTIFEVSNERTTTLVLPMPIELFGPYLNRHNGEREPSK